LHATAQLFKARVYPRVMHDDLRYLAHGCSPVTDR
jgi:hypothetical protein